MSDEPLSVSDELRMQARQQHVSGNTVEAIQLLTQAIQQDPSNTRVAMDIRPPDLARFDFVSNFCQLFQFDAASNKRNQLVFFVVLVLLLHLFELKNIDWPAFPFHPY